MNDKNKLKVEKDKVEKVTLIDKIKDKIKEKLNNKIKKIKQIKDNIKKIPKSFGDLPKGKKALIVIGGLGLTIGVGVGCYILYPNVPKPKVPLDNDYDFDFNDLLAEIEEILKIKTLKVNKKSTLSHSPDSLGLGGLIE